LRRWGGPGWQPRSRSRSCRCHVTENTRMLLEDCSWESVEQRLVRDRRIVLVLGATEQHSDLSVAADTRIPYVIARRACELEDALLAPPLPFGISAWSMAYPGTISLRTSTLAAVVEDIVRSLATAGFRQFFGL